MNIKMGDPAVSVDLGLAVAMWGKVRDGGRSTFAGEKDLNEDMDFSSGGEDQNKNQVMGRAAEVLFLLEQENLRKYVVFSNVSISGDHFWISSTTSKFCHWWFCWFCWTWIRLGFLNCRFTQPARWVNWIFHIRASEDLVGFWCRPGFWFRFVG